MKSKSRELLRTQAVGLRDWEREIKNDIQDYWFWISGDQIPKCHLDALSAAGIAAIIKCLGEIGAAAYSDEAIARATDKCTRIITDMVAVRCDAYVGGVQ